MKLNLTEEERAAQIQRAEELRIKKRAEREEKEKQEAIEREKKRIEDGKQMSALKQQMADQEIKKIAEERAREKRENLLAKERVKAQIEQDKKDRREREARERGEAVVSSTIPAKPVASVAPVSNTPAKDYNETISGDNQKAGNLNLKKIDKLNKTEQSNKIMTKIGFFNKSKRPEHKYNTQPYGQIGRRGSNKNNGGVNVFVNS